jgi:hypothetical protein
LYDNAACAQASNPLGAGALIIPKGFSVEVSADRIKKYPDARRATMDTESGVKEGYVNVTDFE